MIDNLLNGNRHFVANEFQQNSTYYEKISEQQNPQVLWIGCSDSRVSEDVITGSKPGTIFAHRNIANIVAYSDMNLGAILEFALVHLKIPDIVVCGHTRCGGIQAIYDGVNEENIADWLLASTPALELAGARTIGKNYTRDEQLTCLSEENVKVQVKHLHSLSLIRKFEHQGTAPRIHGWLYSVQTGTIKVLVNGNEPPPNLSP
jgi:carbonic anhydrase